MKGIGISLIVWGCIGILFGLQMFGDIGIACIWASVASILAGTGFLSVNKQIQNLWKQKLKTARADTLAATLQHEGFQHGYHGDHAKE